MTGVQTCALPILLRAVSNLTKLTSLNVRGFNDLTEEGLRAVSSLPALTELDLSYSDVTDQALQALRSLGTLTSLILEECEHVTAAGVEALRNTTVAPNLQIEFDE